MTKHPFQQFLEEFIPVVSQKAKALNETIWELETTGKEEIAAKKIKLDTEYKLLFHDPDIYKKLVHWSHDSSLNDELLKRQLNVLIRTFKPNLIPRQLLQEIARKEGELVLDYANFRAKIHNTELTENELKEVLKTERQVDKRKKAWEASKQIGDLMAPKILSLVTLRNEAAESLGYSDYFTMQLDLQEVNKEELFALFDSLAERSKEAYSLNIQYINKQLSERFQVSVDELGPWAWSDPFAQEDPLDTQELDHLVNGLDIPLSGLNYFKQMGFNLEDVLKHSDMYERHGKCQHAFCISIDRRKDVRTLNNVKSTLKWLETVLHEFGHAIYDLNYDDSLPWLLREPPNMLTTEAMALIAGRQAYHPDALKRILSSSYDDALLKKAELSLKRRQLIFSRWVLVMTYFERELYRNPLQNLNKLWWELVKKYQIIATPQGRENKHDWASKYHIGLAPVYYYSYLLGDMVASSLEMILRQTTGSHDIANEQGGKLLREKLFNPGNRYQWSELIKHATGSPLTADAWINQFT